MRISKEEHSAIIKTAITCFGKGISVILFGSRVDDNEKGGDIDLLIINEKYTDKTELFNQKIEFLTYLKEVIGERKIDVLTKYKDDTRDIINTAINTGLKLC